MDARKIERITGSIQRHPDAANWIIARNLDGVTAADVAWVRSGVIGREADQSGDLPIHHSNERLESIPLTGKRIMPQKPQGSDCKRRIREIKRTVAHRVSDFAKILGISEDTLRKHAKELRCLKWLEVRPDDFEEVVMNPETAQQYPR